MAEEKKRDWVDAIAKLLIPVVIFALGQQYACHKDASDQEQRQFDRDAALLKSLASKDETERVLTLQFVNYLHQTRQFPDELWVVVQTTGTGNRSDPSTQTAQLIVQNAAAQDTALTKQLQQTAQGIPTRVYIQIQNEAQRASAEHLRTSLHNAGFVAPVIELRAKESPGRAEVRYFSPSDKSQADQVTQIVHELGLTPEQKDFSGRYHGTVPLRQIEMWFGGQEVVAGGSPR